MIRIADDLDLDAILSCRVWEFDRRPDCERRSASMIILLSRLARSGIVLAAVVALLLDGRPGDSLQSK